MYKTHREKMNVQDAPHRRLGSQEVQRGKEEGHANAGSSEQLVAASESRNGEQAARPGGGRICRRVYADYGNV